MDLSITRHPLDRDPIRLFIDNQMAAEIVCSTALTATDWARELDQARSLQALARFVRQWQQMLVAVRDVPDHAEKTPAARQAAFARGLEAGLCGRTVPHPDAMPGVPPIPPESSRAYGLGYQHGEALRRALALAAPDSEEETP